MDVLDCVPPYLGRKRLHRIGSSARVVPFGVPADRTKLSKARDYIRSWEAIQYGSLGKRKLITTPVMTVRTCNSSKYQVSIKLFLLAFSPLHKEKLPVDIQPFKGSDQIKGQE